MEGTSAMREYVSTKPVRVASLFGALAMLSACVGTDVVYSSDHNGYSTSTFGTAAKKGPIAVFVYGAPGPVGDPADVGDAVAAAFSAAPLTPSASFARAEGDVGREYRVVVRFGSDAHRFDPCGTEGGGEGLDYRAAFCSGDRAISSIHGKLATGDINAPSFSQALASAALTLLPSQNPTIDRRRFAWLVRPAG